jgi:hypothetical protein
MKEEQTQTGNIITDPAIEPYFISMDEYNYTLCMKYVSEKSKREYHTTVGYYPNLRGCLEKLVNIFAKEGTYTSLQEFIEKYDEVTMKLLHLQKYEKTKSSI